MNGVFTIRLSILATVFGVVAGLLIGAPPLRAEESVQAAAQSETTAGYFVEFRAARIGVYGHSYIAYGRLTAGGQPAGIQYADFHPVNGDLGMAVGHLLPVPSAMTLDKSTIKLPLTTAYRRRISAADYRKLTAAIAAERARSRPWNAIAYNCNAFVADMARAVGLSAPSAMLFANAFVAALRDMNEAPRPAVNGNRRNERPKRMREIARTPNA